MSEDPRASPEALALFWLHHGATTLSVMGQSHLPGVPVELRATITCHPADRAVVMSDASDRMDAAGTDVAELVAFASLVEEPEGWAVAGLFDDVRRAEAQEIRLFLRA